jgi:uracil-DNA glycosylase
VLLRLSLPAVIATVHPSSILRAPDDDARHRELKRFTNDLRKVMRALANLS